MSQHKMLRYVFKNAVKLYTLKRFLILWFTDLIFIVLLGWVCVISQFVLFMCVPGK